MDLNTVWFLLVGVLIIGYALLDGFDLGVGSLFYVLGKTDKERKILINAIGPVWDGNEVWLLTGGGALFAAFPLVYASVFSGFYLAMMLVLFALIFRAVAVEYYFKVDTPGLQKLMGGLFFLGSFLPALLFGVAVGNVVYGIPLDAEQNYAGTFFGLLKPFALCFGIVGLFAFLLQGAAYAALKTEGDQQKRARELSKNFAVILLVLWLIGGIYSKMAAPHLWENYQKLPLLYVLPLITLVSLILIPGWVRKNAYQKVFTASSIAFATMILTVAAGLYPNWVIATDPAKNLTIYNASSSPLTLKVMLFVALIGVPIVLLYTIYTYRVFRGKASPERNGY
ncbi:cytochrome d ubiquinol oxidase subunit II [Carboxydothermus ferrireducens]|uniref:Cytochrome d ubiquinol oxidase subunit II n=1 Tax=Carboxydothermus ferrireducens DSM 11255 TaxID=1119529 RepID=A0ABX2R9H4_9THEO|nr:cytochrome d ubiquinol oxidase subunit II [Carboxydothermus ferrireducens]NYE57827.1 cytochrome d ubiquinol oxidase subunit II [Carboxydothermus ferrireducens DSM 11255]